MKHRLLFVVFSLAISTALFAQASGGQIKRSTTKSRTETRKKSKSRRVVQTEQITSIDSPSAIQPIPISRLSKFNVVAGTFSLLPNAQGLCQSLRDKGWSAQIFCDSSINMYRVIMVGTNEVSEAMEYRNKAWQSYPGAWIMVVENGQIYRYE